MDKYDIVNTKEKAEALERDYDQAGKLVSFLHKEIATVRQTLQTHRTINHWDHLGLLLPQRTTDNEWRRFSISDLFWIHVIDSLRDFGYPTEKIKIVKSQLFGKTLKKNTLNKYILEVLTLGDDWYLLIFPSGQIAFESSAANVLNRKGHDFIRVSLYEILEKILGNKDIAQISPTLSKEELSLLLNIRKGNYKEISIKLTDGKIKRFEATQDVEAGSKAFEVIRQLIREGDFQDVVIKQQGGKVVSIVKTTKSKNDVP